MSLHRMKSKLSSQYRGSLAYQGGWHARSGVHQIETYRSSRGDFVTGREDDRAAWTTARPDCHDLTARYVSASFKDPADP